MIYISGPTDIERLPNLEVRFADAQQYLEHVVKFYEDHNVINSFTEFSGKEFSSLKEEVIIRLNTVNKCDKIYMLMGWEKDRMSRVEHEFASASGMRIIYSKKF